VHADGAALATPEALLTPFHAAAERLGLSAPSSQPGLGLRGHSLHEDFAALGGGGGGAEGRALEAASAAAAAAQDQLQHLQREDGSAGQEKGPPPAAQPQESPGLSSAQRWEAVGRRRSDVGVRRSASASSLASVDFSNV